MKPYTDAVIPAGTHQVGGEECDGDQRSWRPLDDPFGCQRVHGQEQDRPQRSVCFHGVVYSFFLKVINGASPFPLQDR